MVRFNPYFGSGVRRKINRGRKERKDRRRKREGRERGGGVGIREGTRRGREGMEKQGEKKQHTM